jgi:hypothetical protein
VITLADVILSLKRIDEVSLLEVLEISSEDIVDRFVDKIEENYDKLAEDFEEEQEDFQSEGFREDSR